jgi:PPM family protein phosphatase
MKVRPGIELANLTDIGCHRTENQDYYGYAEPDSDEEFAKRGRLAVVADGMGGHQGGRAASVLAVDVVRQAYFESEAQEPPSALASALAGAHAAIQTCAEENPELTGMGTTCTAVALQNGQVHYVHVGDSRLYLVRDSSISQLTRDHSYVNRLLDQGILTPEEAAVHPNRNVLTAALGMPGDVPAEVGDLMLQKGDLLLLCTDGLHGPVHDEEMLAVVTENPPREACEKLIEMAKARGGFDNITLQILRVEGAPAPQTQEEP